MSGLLQRIVTGARGLAADGPRPRPRPLWEPSRAEPSGIELEVEGAPMDASLDGPRGRAVPRPESQGPTPKRSLRAEDADPPSRRAESMLREPEPRATPAVAERERSRPYSMPPREREPDGQRRASDPPRAPTSDSPRPNASSPAPRVATATTPRRSLEPTVELVSPRSEPEAEAQRETSAPPVRVTIERIEVRMDAPRRPEPRPRSSRRSGLDLDEYLARRGKVG